MVNRGKLLPVLTATVAALVLLHALSAFVSAPALRPATSRPRTQLHAAGVDRRGAVLGAGLAAAAAAVGVPEAALADDKSLKFSLFGLGSAGVSSDAYNYGAEPYNEFPRNNVNENLYQDNEEMFAKSKGYLVKAFNEYREKVPPCLEAKDPDKLKETMGIFGAMRKQMLMLTSGGVRKDQKQTEQTPLARKFFEDVDAVRTFSRLKQWDKAQNSFRDSLNTLQTFENQMNI